MRTIEVRQLKYDLTPVAGLALMGDHLKTVAPVLARLDAALPVRGGVSSSDIVRSYLGLLVQGKSDFDAIENHRGNSSTSTRWASRCCPRARRCASAWTRRPTRCRKLCCR